MPNIVTFPLTDPHTEEQDIEHVLPCINFVLENYPKLSGFGGDCWAAAIAINEILLHNKGQVIGVFNKALFESSQYMIGHVVVHYLTDEIGDDFIDMDGFKSFELIDSWGNLDIEDPDNITLFKSHNIPLEESHFEDIIVVQFTNEELQQVKYEKLKEYRIAFTHALEYISSPIKDKSITKKLRI